MITMLSGFLIASQPISPKNNGQKKGTLNSIPFLKIFQFSYFLISNQLSLYFGNSVLIF